MNLKETEHEGVKQNQLVRAGPCT